MPTIWVIDGHLDLQLINTSPDLGRASSGLSIPVALSTEDQSSLDAARGGVKTSTGKIIYPQDYAVAYGYDDGLLVTISVTDEDDQDWVQTLTYNDDNTFASSSQWEPA